MSSGPEATNALVTERSPHLGMTKGRDEESQSLMTERTLVAKIRQLVEERIIISRK